MTETSLGRVQGGGFFGSTSTSETEIPKESVSAADIRPLIGDTIVNFNGSLCRIDDITDSHYIVAKYGSIKGAKGDKGDKGDQGVSINESGAYPNMTVGQATNADTLDGKHASEFATSAQGIKADNALPSSAIGYATSGRNYGILKSASDKLYVNVPWTDSGANKLPLAGGTLTGEVKAPAFCSSRTNIDYIDFCCGNGNNFGLRGEQNQIYDLSKLKSEIITIYYAVQTSQAAANANNAQYGSLNSFSARKIRVGDFQLVFGGIPFAFTGDRWVKIVIPNSVIFNIQASGARDTTEWNGPVLSVFANENSDTAYIGLDNNSTLWIDYTITCSGT